MELIQGEGRIISASVAFMKELRELCNQYNLLLIFD